MSSTISSATQEIGDLLILLDNAFWESNSIEHKDILYNIITILNAEVMELNKVSVQDGNYRYEPATETMRILGPQLDWLLENMKHVAIRTNTASPLGSQLRKVIEVLT